MGSKRVKKEIASTKSSYEPRQEYKSVPQRGCGGGGGDDDGTP